MPNPPPPPPRKSPRPQRKPPRTEAEPAEEAELTDEQKAAVLEEFNATASAASNFRIDNLWILIAAFLVFTMHLGFATLESGLTQKKNTVNILFKNVFIISMGLITYYIGLQPDVSGLRRWHRQRDHRLQRVPDSQHGSDG
jgi:hypothetical protein